MNLLLIGDVHNQRIDLSHSVNQLKDPNCPSLGDVELVLCTGDFETLDALQNIEAQLNVPFYFVHGNHDNLEIEWHPANIHLKEVNVDGLVIRGLGGVPPDFFTCSASWESEEEMYEMWLFKESQGGILLTHVPPFGILDDDGNGNHYGSHTVLRIMEETKPHVLICGHVHQSFGAELVNNTKVINCGSIQENNVLIIRLGDLTNLYHKNKKEHF